MSNESMHQEQVVSQSQEADVIISKIAELSQALEENNPSIATYVKDIHRNLLQFPELVHILKPEQVQTIVKGIEQVNGEKIAEEAKPKARASKAGSKSKASLADLLDGI